MKIIVTFGFKIQLTALARFTVCTLDDVGGLTDMSSLMCWTSIEVKHRGYRKK